MWIARLACSRRSPFRLLEKIIIVRFGVQPFGTTLADLRTDIPDVLASLLSATRASFRSLAAGARTPGHFLSRDIRKLAFRTAPRRH